MYGLNVDAMLGTCTKGWQEQRLLCDELEAIADSLPDNVDQPACMHAARVLPTLLIRTQQNEEKTLFSALERARTALFDPTPTLDRLRIEHAGDQCFAEELSEVLLSWGRGLPMQSPEATGYMLRGFFEGLRRHVATEEELAGMFGKSIAGSDRSRSVLTH